MCAHVSSVRPSFTKMISRRREDFSNAAQIRSTSGFTFALSLRNGTMTEISGFKFETMRPQFAQTVWTVNRRTVNRRTAGGCSHAYRDLPRKNLGRHALRAYEPVPR